MARSGADVPNRVLVLQTAFLGDVVLTTPLFRALRRRLPDARIDALVTPAAAPLIEEDPHLDRVLRYDKKGKDGFLAMGRQLRAARYDAVVVPHRSHRSAMLARLSAAPVRVGFADAGFSFLFTQRVRRPPGRHEVDRNLALLQGLGFEAEPGDRVLHVGYTPREAEAVDRVLGEFGVGPGERLVGLAPGSVWATKRWPAERFARVGRELAAQGARVVVLGGPDDREVAETVCAGVGPGTVNAAGRTSLKALAAWMDRLALLVTNDSAPLHVAAARGTPTVAVFGATTLDLGFGPFHEASRVVEAEVSCRPCGLHGGRRCRKGHFRCMLDIRPQDVLRAAGELLEGVGLP